MKTYYECLPCFCRQALTALKNIDPSLHEVIMRRIMRMFADADYSCSPPELAGKIFKVIGRYSEVKDFFAAAKKMSNQYVLGIYDELKAKIEKSEDPFAMAVRLSVAGNIIDFGAKHDFSMDSVSDEIDNALNADMDATGISRLQDEVIKARNILFLGDNAGEIVFDRLLIEYMPREKLIYAVRGGPVINDALMADAVETGITSIVKVIDNGSNLPGTCLDKCSVEFNRIFSEADLVISKGQGNYETLSDIEKNIFFLLKIKCEVVARDLMCSPGESICRKSTRSGRESRESR